MQFFIKNRNDIMTGSIIALISYSIIEIFKFLVGLLKENKNFIWKILDYKFSAEIKIYYIIIFVFLWLILNNLYEKYKLSKNELKILSAEYFSEKNSLDITHELNKAIEKNRLKIVLSNNIAGDPHFGFPKKAKIIYKINDIQYNEEYAEGDVVDIPKFK